MGEIRGSKEKDTGLRRNKEKYRQNKCERWRDSITKLKSSKSQGKLKQRMNETEKSK